MILKRFPHQWPFVKGGFPSPVTGGFPLQRGIPQSLVNITIRPVFCSFYGFFGVRMNKLLNGQSSWQGIETSCFMWRHRNELFDVLRRLVHHIPRNLLTCFAIFCLGELPTNFYAYISVLHRWYPWWRHQMETFSALLALCAGNSPVTGKFPAQRPVTRSFDVFFDLCLNKRLSKIIVIWSKTQSRSLWRQCNADHCYCLPRACDANSYNTGMAHLK